MKSPNEIWIRESLLRLRSSENAEEESLGNRTVAISKIPRWATEADISKHLSSFGNVLYVDMPKTDARIENIRRNAPNIENEKEVQRTYEEGLQVADNLFTRLQYIENPHLNFKVNMEDFKPMTENPSEQTTLAEKVLNFDKDLYSDQVMNTVSHTPPSDLSVINNEKRMKILTLCTMVYNENQLVNNTIKDLKVERDNIVNRLNNVMEYPEIPGHKSKDSFITAEQIQTLKSYLSYVDKNHDSLPPEIVSEVRENKAFQVIRDYHIERSGELPSDNKVLKEALEARISKSQDNLQKELADGYQWLLQSLERREEVLQHRLDRLLADYGKKDRVLVTDKDFKNEKEDIKFRDYGEGTDALKLEDIISISEQMRNISEWKRPKSIEEIMHRTEYESFFRGGTPNFAEFDINFSEVTPRTADLLMRRKVGREGHLDLGTLHSSVPNNYDPQVMRKVMRKVNEAREELDTPFDEMYHKEKALIDNIVKAEKELLQAQEAAESALQESNRSIEHLFDNNLVGLFEQEDDLRVLLKKQSNYDDSADSLFSERKTLSKNYQDLVMEMIGDKDIDKYLDQQGNIENMGYCFATFTHTDEAKRAIMFAEHLRIDTTTRSHQHLFNSFGKSEMYMKNDLSHEDFNIDYLKERTLSDAKIIDKKENLRRAKRKLKQYEDTFEEQMPKTARLNKMKRAAKDAIEGNYHFDRASFPRSKLEEEQLEQKIRDMEKRTGADFAPLFDNEQKEKERVERHKKALETYKSYSFLKAGLKKTELEKKLTEDTREDITQYKFPSPDEVASTFVNQDYKYSMLREGEENLAPGRKYKFTPTEYLEKYFGKDYLSGQSLEITDRPMYSFNDEMKRAYPYSSVSENPITPLEKKQELTHKYASETFQLSRDEMPPHWRDEKDLKQKNSQSQRLTIEDHEIIPDNPYLEEDWKTRKAKFEKQLNKKESVLKESRWGTKQIKDFQTRETAGYSIRELERREKVLEKEIERLEAEKGQKTGEGTGEKWKPSLEEKIKSQDAREKVYSEYIDKRKIEAFQEGNVSKYNTAELEFLKKYKKVALDPNLNVTDGAPYRIQRAENDFSSDLLSAREDHQKKLKNLKYLQKLDKKIKEREDMKVDSLAEREKGLNYQEPREDMKKINDQFKSTTRENNEEFFYRQEYAKRNPELMRAINQEESVMTKKFRNATPDEFTHERDLKANKDSWAMSDRKLGSFFSENLRKGDIVKGLLKRKEQLKQGQLDKDLSEIAMGNEQEAQDLYKNYMSYERPQKRINKEEEIAERERNFLEAVERNYQNTSPSAQKTFQDYEDYKRRVQVEIDEYDEVDNDVTQMDKNMSTRDWYSKIWTGKISNEEFGEYMFEGEKTKDKLGYDKTIYTQKDNPGYGKKDFVSTEDSERILRELHEVKRRKSVLQGLCTEAESHEYVENIHKNFDRVHEKMNQPHIRDHMDEFMEIAKAATAGEQVREYYFDPYQGVTLEEHLESVKKVYPDAKIESFTDDDGFTVVKRTSEVKYKYNLNDLLNYAPNEVERKYHKGVKAVIDLNNVTIENEEDLVRFLEDPKYKESEIYGELMNIQEKYGDIIDDIDTFKREIREQIEIKKLRYKYFKKLTPEDFIKPQIPEHVVMEKLKESYEQRILNYEAEFDVSGQNRDYLESLKGNKSAYNEACIDPEVRVLTKGQYKKLREKLKDTKQAKARLLKQGFPTLENYVYL